eukprot:scaffold185382_cov31-Tisochrysis_lutea.AAC.1
MHPHVMLTEEELRAQQDASAESDMSLFEDIDMGRRGRQCGFLNGTAASYVSQLGLSVSAADPASEYQSRPPPEPYPQSGVPWSEWPLCKPLNVVRRPDAGGAFHDTFCRIPCQICHTITSTSSHEHIHITISCHQLQQILESEEPDLLVYQHCIIDDDSKPDLEDHQFVSPQANILHAPTPLEYHF